MDKLKDKNTSAALPMGFISLFVLPRVIGYNFLRALSSLNNKTY